MFSPHLLHPTACFLASSVEYSSGRRPSLYKLSSLQRFTMDNLERFTNQTGISRPADRIATRNLPISYSTSRVRYFEVVPLRVPLSVQVRSQIELIIRVSDLHDFAQIPRLETRLEMQICIRLGRIGRPGYQKYLVIRVRRIVSARIRCRFRCERYSRVSAHARPAELLIVRRRIVNRSVMQE